MAQALNIWVELSISMIFAALKMDSIMGNILFVIIVIVCSVIWKGWGSQRATQL